MKPSQQPGPRYQALLQLLRTAETIWNTSRVFFEQWDLSPSQFNILNLLRGYPDGVTQTQLSRELLMHRSNITGLVDRLEARGLVRRVASAEDRRAWRVCLTPAGHKLMEKVLPYYYGAAEAVWGDLPMEQVEQTLTTLHRLTANAEQIPRSPT